MIDLKKTKKADLETKRATLFLAGIVIALGFTLLAFEWKQPVKKTSLALNGHDYFPPEDLVIPITKPEKAEPEKPIIKIPVFKVIRNELNIENELIWEGEEPEEPVLIDFGDLMNSGKDMEEDNLNGILITAEVMPEFPGGDAALLSYLAKNIKYPLVAQENGIEGKVYVSFVVDEQGSVCKVELVRGIDSALDREAIRVVKSMPGWKPGRQGDTEVKVRFTVPINFTLQ